MSKESDIMEKGEMEHVDISGEDLGLDGKGGVFGEEAVASSYSHSNGIGIQVDHSGETSASLGTEEGFEEEGFEPVSLNDQENESSEFCNREGSGASLASDSLASPTGLVEQAEDLASERVVDIVESSQEHTRLNAGHTSSHSASSSFDGYTGSGLPHIEPLPKLRPKTSMSSVSPDRKSVV